MSASQEQMWVDCLLEWDEATQKRGEDWARQIAKSLLASSLLEPGDLDGVTLAAMAFDGLDQVQEAVVVRMQRKVERAAAEPSLHDTALMVQARLRVYKAYTFLTIKVLEHSRVTGPSDATCECRAVQVPAVYRCKGKETRKKVHIIYITHIIYKPCTSRYLPGAGGHGRLPEACQLGGSRRRPLAKHRCGKQACDRGEKAEGQRVKNPFVYADVKQFMPAWMGDSSAKDDEDEEAPEAVTQLSNALGLTRHRPKGTLSLTKWMASFDNYMMAAAAVEQWSFPAAYAHKTVVMQVAMDQTDGRPPLVAVVYDELVRRRMADRLLKNAPDFHPDKGTHTPDEGLLKQAEKVYAERGSKYHGGKGTGGKGAGSQGSDSWKTGKWSKGWQQGDTTGGSGYDSHKRTYPWEAKHHDGAKKHKGGTGKGGASLTIKHKRYNKKKHRSLSIYMLKYTLRSRDVGPVIDGTLCLWDVAPAIR